MRQSQTISWKRISAEGLAIVTSILFAFAIDAWWQDRQQVVSDNTHLATVVTELRAHETLLAEAISAHQKTAEVGKVLLESFSSSATKGSASNSPQLFADIMTFYQINAPFGALETAMSAGAIARMKNTELSAALANWPVAIDDLIEEQETGRNLMFSLFSKMAEVTPMTEVYRAKLLSPTIRGTSVVADASVIQLAPSQSNFSSTAVFENIEIHGALLMQMALAQSAEAEATEFATLLRALVERLEGCLGESSC